MPSIFIESALAVQEYEEDKPAKHSRGSRKDDFAHAAATPLPKDPADETDAGDEHEEANKHAKAALKRRKAGHAAQKGGNSDMHGPSPDATHPVHKVLLLPPMRTHGIPHIVLRTLCCTYKAAKSVPHAAPFVIRMTDSSPACCRRALAERRQPRL